MFYIIPDIAHCDKHDLNLTFKDDQLAMDKVSNETI